MISVSFVDWQGMDDELKRLFKNNDKGDFDMKKIQTWLISATLVLCACGLTACGNKTTTKNGTATTTENAADKTNAADTDRYGNTVETDQYGNVINTNDNVNGATDTTNGNGGVVGDAIDDVGDAGKGVIEGVGDAGKAVIDGVEDLGDDLTGNRNHTENTRDNTVVNP